MSTAKEIVVITHPQDDKGGSITEALDNVPDLEKMVLVYGTRDFESSLAHTMDGQLSSEHAQDILTSYDSISIFGGCLNECHYRTYKSLVDAFKNSSKKELTIKFFLDGIFNFDPVDKETFNLKEILDSEQSEGREQEVLDMFKKYTSYASSMGINCNLTYNGGLPNINGQNFNKTLSIEIFDTTTILSKADHNKTLHTLSPAKVS
jgi:hypothetical protein